jgi:ssRNA-specific RNase YbeY (16S rRNA maturation enzyme)
MINFNYENEFNLENEDANQAGFRQFCQKGRKREKSIISCDDEYLHKINLEYLNMMTLRT